MRQKICENLGKPALTQNLLVFYKKRVICQTNSNLSKHSGDYC